MTYLEPPPGQAPVVVVRDVGGYVDQYREQTERYRRENREVRLHECRSACTLALSLPNVCVYADSIVKFHKAYNENTRIADESVSRELMASYPPAVQARLGQLTRDYRVLRGAELIELGIRDCNEKRTILVAKNAPPAERATGISRAMESLVSSLLNPADLTGANKAGLSSPPRPLQVAAIAPEKKSGAPTAPVSGNLSTTIEVPLPPSRPADLIVTASARPLQLHPARVMPGALPTLPSRFMAYAPLSPKMIDLIAASLR